MNTETAKRQVTLYNTVGQNKKVLDSEASCWKDLKTELSNLNISFNNMRAIVGGSNVTLESPNAILPETDFLLFLFPIKVKSGNCFDEDDGIEMNTNGFSHHFDYAKDTVENYLFANAKEEIKVRLQLIINGCNKNKEYAEKLLEIIESAELSNQTPSDPAIQELAAEAARIAKSLDE
jgi:hypothetical protein